MHIISGVSEAFDCYSVFCLTSYLALVQSTQYLGFCFDLGCKIAIGFGVEHADYSVDPSIQNAAASPKPIFVRRSM